MSKIRVDMNHPARVGIISTRRLRRSLRKGVLRVEVGGTLSGRPDPGHLGNGWPAVCTGAVRGSRNYSNARASRPLARVMLIASENIKKDTPAPFTTPPPPPASATHTLTLAPSANNVFSTEQKRLGYCTTSPDINTSDHPPLPLAAALGT